MELVFLRCCTRGSGPQRSSVLLQQSGDEEQLWPEASKYCSAIAPSQRALMSVQAQAPNSGSAATGAGTQADLRFSPVEQLVCSNLGYELRPPRERAFPWTLCLCSLAVCCAATAGYLAGSQAGQQLSGARLMLRSYEEVAAALVPKATEALTENATILGRTLNQTMRHIDSEIAELPEDAGRFAQLQLSVMEKPTSAWGIQLAFQTLQRSQDAEARLGSDFRRALAKATAFLRQQWVRQSAPLAPLIADVKELLGFAPAVLAALRQTLGFRIVELSRLLPGLRSFDGWDSIVEELERLASSGPKFTAAKQRLAKVEELIQSLQVGLEDAVASLQREADDYNSTLGKARKAVEGFRISAEDQARRGGQNQTERARQDADIWLNDLMSQTERLYLQLQMHAKGARDIVKRMAKQTAAEPALLETSVAEARSGLAAELEPRAGAADRSLELLVAGAYGVFLPAFCGSLLLLAVVALLVGLYIEYRFERSVRQEAVANLLYMRGLCAYHESAPRFDAGFGDNLCNPLVRQFLRIRHALLYHPLLGIVMGALAVAAAALTGLLALTILFFWNQGQIVAALAPLCSSAAAVALADDGQCTGLLHNVSEALGVPGLSEADVTCESKQLLVCSQLVAPLARASSLALAAFLVAAVPLAALWPLLQRQLSSVFAGMLSQARSLSDY